jgi:hypothetical protein
VSFCAIREPPKSDPDISKRLFGNDAFRLSPRQELFLIIIWQGVLRYFECCPLRQRG